MADVPGDSAAQYAERLAHAQAVIAAATAAPVAAIQPTIRFSMAQEVATLAAPAWAPFIRKWQPRSRAKQAIPQVHGREIWFDNQTSLPELAAIILHKTDHLVMGHQERRHDRDEQKWNVAACLEDIRRWRDIFENLGIALPPSIDPSLNFDDLPRDVAETLYEQIDDRQEQSTPHDDEGQQTSCNLEGDEFDHSMLSPSDGVDRDGEDVAGRDDEPHEGPLNRKSHADAAAEQSSSGQGAGSDDDRLDPRAPYTNMMRKVCKKLNLGRNRMNFSLRRPSNRSDQTGGGVLSKLERAPDRLRIVIDSSGSLSKELLSAIHHAVTDLETYAKKDGIIDRTVYAHGDDELAAVGAGHKLRNLKGRGNTDMQKVIDDAVAHPRMSGGTAWVIITDGYTQLWPAQLPPNCVVILVNNVVETGKPAPEILAEKGWGVTRYRVPEHIRNAALCITKSDFIAGGAPQRGLE